MMSSLLRSFLTLLRRRETAGAVAVEFAIFVSLFLMIVAATIDYGFWIFTASELTAAVSAGSQYAVNNAAMVSSSPATLQSDIGTVVDNAVGTAWATSTVNVNNGGDKTGCYCPTGSPGSWTWGTAVTCGSTCAGGSTVVAGQFVTITASPSASVPALFPTYGLTYTGTISRGALVRLE